MNDFNNRRHETFARMHNFGEARTGDFAPNSLAVQLFATLATVIATLETYASKHVSSHGAARQGTATREEARAVLRELMETIRRTARVMAQDITGLDDKFRMPPPGNDQLLLTSARAFLVDATPLAAQFIAHELPADFLQDLADAIAALEAAMNEQASSVGNAVAARATIEETFELGMDTRSKLDAIMKNKYANNPAVLAEWARASHIERAPKRKAEPSQPKNTPDDEDSGASAGDSGGSGTA